MISVKYLQTLKCAVSKSLVSSHRALFLELALKLDDKNEMS